MAQEALIPSPLRDGHKHQNSQALKFLRESYERVSTIEQKARSYPGVQYKLQFSRDTLLAVSAKARQCVSAACFAVTLRYLTNASTSTP